MKYVILILLSQIANADDWFCKTQHAKRSGNVLSICGVGMGWASVPEQGRWEAFKDAKLNFESICRMSSDCLNHRISVEPKRTECEQKKGSGLETCYQLLEITILE